MFSSTSSPQGDTVTSYCPIFALTNTSTGLNRLVVVLSRHSRSPSIFCFS
jgi:hypothetical protein